MTKIKNFSDFLNEKYGFSNYKFGYDLINGIFLIKKYY